MKSTPTRKRIDWKQSKAVLDFGSGDDGDDDDGTIEKENKKNDQDEYGLLTNFDSIDDGDKENENKNTDFDDDDEQ